MVSQYPRIKAALALLAILAGCATAEMNEQNGLLIRGVKEGNPEMVRQALGMGADARARGAGRNSLLHVAVRIDPKAVETLIARNGKEPGACVPEPDAPACKYFIGNRIEVARILLLHGISVHSRNNRGETPLHAAVGNIFGPSPDLPSIPPAAGRISSFYGWRNTPMEKGSDYHRAIDIAAANGTKIHAAANGVIKSTGINDHLGNYIVLDHGNGHETVYGHCHLINIKCGSRVKRGDIIGYVGETGNATGSHCHYEVRLNGRPIDPFPYMVSGFLNELNCRYASSIADLLIKHGADPDCSDAHGRTPLHEACSRAPAIAKYLIARGCRVNARDENGVTPLHEASAHHEELVKYLVSKGADINVRTTRPSAIGGKLYPQGATPLKVAEISGNHESADFLQSRGAVR